MKKSRFAFVVAASPNYIPGLNAFFNSLKTYQPDTDVVLVSFRLPEKNLNKYAGLCKNLRVVNINSDDQVRGTAIERFRVAYEYGQDYEAICELDADMFLTADNSLFFEISSKGFVVTGSNGMIVNFGENYQKKYGIDLGKKNLPYPKVHTTVPVFISPRDLNWFKELYDARRVDSFDDLWMFNILGIKLGIDKRMLVMPPYTFTGIHHFGVKPVTGWIEKEGLLLSGTEEKVYMVHGKWWDEDWRRDLTLQMERFYNEEGSHERLKEQTQKSIQIAYNRFRQLSK